MKKYTYFALILLPLALTACSKKEVKSQAAQVQAETQIQTESKMEEKKMEREFITNGLAGDCPVEYKDLRGNVVYGKVLHEQYYSKTCKMDRYYSILLPAGYNQDDKETKYPVVYFQHGIFGDEKCMVYDDANKFKQISANLAADGKAKKMIIVFGNMFATEDPEQKPAFTTKDTLPYDNFINELTNDLMPLIESSYNVLTGRKNTAVCGFSMGGRESLYIGLNRPDLFGYIGAIAPAPGLVPAKDWAMEHAGMFATEPEMKFADGAELPEFFMVCCGTDDKTVGKFPKSYHEILEKNGVEHTWFEVLSADHNSYAIRSGLYWFLSNIF